MIGRATIRLGIGPHSSFILFPATMWGEPWEMFVIVTSLSWQGSDNTDIFLNQLIQCNLNDGDKSSPLNFTQYAVLPDNIEIIV